MTTSFLATLITHFPQILVKISPTPIGLTAPSSLSSGIRRLATMGLYGHRINVLRTQSPCDCGYCLTQACR